LAFPDTQWNLDARESMFSRAYRQRHPSTNGALAASDVAPYVNNVNKIAKVLADTGLSKGAVEGTVWRINHMAKVLALGNKIRQVQAAAVTNYKHDSGTYKVWCIENSGKAYTAGTISLLNSKLRFHAMPAYITLMQNLMHETVYDFNGNAIDARRNPAGWFDRFWTLCLGHRLRCKLIGNIHAGGPGSGRRPEKKEAQVPEHITDQELEDMVELGFEPIFPTTHVMQSGGPGSGRHKGAATQQVNKYNQPILTQKQKLAVANQKPAGKHAQRMADKVELMVRNAVGGVHTADNMPFDVLSKDGKNAIEVKALINNSNDKITMKRDAMQRKYAWANKNKASIHLSLWICGMEVRHRGLFITKKV